MVGYGSHNKCVVLFIYYECKNKRPMAYIITFILEIHYGGQNAELGMYVLFGVCLFVYMFRSPRKVTQCQPKLQRFIMNKSSNRV